MNPRPQRAALVEQTETNTLTGPLRRLDGTRIDGQLSACRQQLGPGRLRSFTKGTPGPPRLEYGRLDVAFANAGIDPGVGFVGAWAGGARPRVDDGALERYADERWNRVIDVNLNGVFATARAAARHMRPRRFGRIIVTTPLAATKVEPAIGSAYMAAKAGARHLTHCIALELAAYGITTNAIAPGFFVTNIGGGHAHDPDLQAAIAKDIPMHRVGQPDDIEALALFLASPASEYITGQEIVIGGGPRLGVAD